MLPKLFVGFKLHHKQINVTLIKTNHTIKTLLALEIQISLLPKDIKMLIRSH